MVIRVRICQWLAMIYWSLDMPKSCEWLIDQSWYAQSLANDWSCLDMSKSWEWLIGIGTCQCLANDLLEFWYAKVLRMIDRSLDMPWFREWLIRVLKYLEATGTCSNISFFFIIFVTLIYDYTLTCSNTSFFSSFFHINIWLYYNSSHILIWKKWCKKKYCYKALCYYSIIIYKYEKMMKKKKRNTATSPCAWT